MNDLEIIPSVFLDENQDLTVAVLYSPFDPSKRDVARVIYRRDAPLSYYLDGLPDKEDWLVHVNGMFVPLDLWHIYIPQPADSVVIVANVFGGGGDDKGILRVIAMVGVAILSAYTGGLAAGALAKAGAISATSVTAVTAGVGAVVSLAGGMLVNALLPMPEMDTGSGSDEGNSQTYGFGKPTTGRGQGGSVPIVYGEHAVGGVIIGLDRSLEPDSNDELLSLLLAVGEGEIQEISGIKINDQPIDTYEEVSWAYTKGKLDEKVTSDFSGNVRVPIDVSRKVTQEFMSIEMPAGTNVAELMMSFPSGLVTRYDDSNDKDPRAVDLDIKIGVKGQGMVSANLGEQSLGWDSEYSDPRNRHTTALFQVTAKDNYSATIIVERQHSGSDSWDSIATRRFSGHTSWEQHLSAGVSVDESEGRYKYRYTLSGSGVRIVTASLTQRVGSVLRIEDCTHESKRVMLNVGLTPNVHNEIYVVEVRRINEESESDYIQDEMWLNEIEAMSTLAVKHRGTACVRIKMRATDQLNGMPSILCQVKGLKVNTYDRRGKTTGFTWSNNPAWIALDVLLRWGGVPPRLVDFNSFVDFAVFCNFHSLTFNGVFDQTSNNWDALQKILRAGMAQINPLGSKIALILHEHRDAVMLFNSSNMIKGSFSSSWTSSQDRSNVFEGEYYEAAADNAAALIKITDAEELARGVPVRESKIGFMGVTNRPQAEKLLSAYRAMNRFVTMSVSFDAYLDSMACTIGDAIIVQSDHIHWGKSFRIAMPSGSRSEINYDLSDEDVEKFGRYILIHYPTMDIGGGVVESINGNQITLVKPTVPVNRIHVLRSAGRDFHIIAKEPLPNNRYLFEVAESGLSAADPLRFVQFDYLFKSAVADINYDNNTLRTVAEMPLSPPLDALVSLGATEVVAKKFIITAITGDGDFQRSVSAIEYNQSLFNLNGDFDYEDPINPVEPLTAVRDVRVVEEVYKNGLTTLTRALITWSKPLKGAYKNARVTVETGGSVIREKSVVGMDKFIVDRLKDGDVLNITVNSIDQAGMICPAAVNVTHVIAGTTAAPARVKGLMLQRTFTGLEAVWNANREADVVAYQLRSGDVWEEGEIVIERTDTTTANIPRKEAGVYQAMVKAIDVNGTFSTQAAFSDVEIYGPDPVSGFTAIQNDRMIILRWDRHPNPDVVSYIIRRGISFSNSEHLADVSGNSYSLDADAVDIEEYFWAVAVDRFGVASGTPAFTKIARNPLEDYNVINTINISQDGWLGDRINFEIDEEGSLVGVADQSYCEYYHNVKTGAVGSSRILLRDYPFAKDDDATWIAFDQVMWSEADNVFWVPFGMADGQSYERDISRGIGHASLDITEGYDCFDVANMLRGVRGTTAINEGVTLHDPILLRGGTMGVGISGGTMTFPFPMAASESHVYLSLAVIGKTTIAVQSGKATEMITIENRDSEYHISVGGEILIVPLGLGATQTHNRVINIMIRRRRDKCVASFNIHGSATSVTAEYQSDIDSRFDQVAISTDAGSPQCYIRTVREERVAEISGETQTAHYLNRFSRTCDYARFERYAAGFYEAHSVDLRFSMSVSSLSITPGISSSVAIIDMPDVIDRGYIVIDVDDNVPVSFNRKFTVPPRVIPQFGGAIGDVPATAVSVFALDVTADTFYIAAYDGSGQRVRGMVNWQASGY